MPEPQTLVDAADPRLDDFRDLRTPDARRDREGDRFLVAEGPNVVRRLLTTSLHRRAVLVLDTKVASMADVVDAADCPVYVVSRDVLREVVGFDLHRGVLATADRPRDPGLTAATDAALAAAGTLLVLQGLNDHENLGAIARTARAFGVTALVLDPTCADPWYRRTVRVSMGEVLSLPVTRCEDVGAALTHLRSCGVTVASLTPQRQTTAGPSVDIDRWVRPAGALALVLGAEGPGLPDTTFLASDVRLRIPIDDDVDSLNVGHATAAALALTRR